MSSLSDLSFLTFCNISFSFTDSQQCTESFVIRSIVAMLPAYFRFAQCMRRFRDTKEAFPHLVNAGKII